MAKTLDEKQKRLAGLAMFKGADARALKHLAGSADEISVSAGDTLIRQGTANQELYIFETGSGKVEIDGNHVADIDSGELIGELGYFVRTPASATVTAAEDSVVLVIPYNRFAEILDDNPQLVRAIAVELAERLHAMDERLRTS
jgi:CRP-like cAMP-binding protein